MDGYVNGGFDGHVNGGLNGDSKNGYTKGGLDVTIVDVPTGTNQEPVRETKEEEEQQQEQEEEEDPWKVVGFNDDYVPWSMLDQKGRILRVLSYIFLPILVLGLLYIFICNLDLLSSGFKLVGGRAAGKVFRENQIFSNPLAGLMIGVLVTVLVQSSSTSTSIIISMVGAQILEIKMAIPMIMGANIGTSVTNTIVSLAQAGDKSQFRRAFAGATIHDMFNWLTVIVLLPLELISGYLYRLSGVIIDSLGVGQNKYANQDLLKVITTPLTKLIVQVNKNVITDIAITSKNDSAEHNPLMKLCSDKTTPLQCCVSKYSDLGNDTTTMSEMTSFCVELNSCVKRSNEPATQGCLNHAWNGTAKEFSCDRWIQNETDCLKPTQYLFRGLHGKLTDELVGVILLVVSLVLLCLCLFLMVKALNAVLKGPMANAIKKFVNADFPGRLSYITGYLAILLGCGMTILVQSSSIFTSTLTPLVGVGVVELHRMYPLTLGSNIGTTVTGIMAALAQDSNTIEASLQVAFCHLFFNISGIVLFYVIPFMRFPIGLAKFLGNTTAKYRWFAVFYVLFMFFAMPAIVFGLSIPGWYVMVGVLAPFALVLLVVAVVKCIQHKRPGCLPQRFQDWKWLPLPLRSLAPYDACVQRVLCKCCRGKDVEEERKKSQAPQENGTMAAPQQNGKDDHILVTRF